MADDKITIDDINTLQQWVDMYNAKDKECFNALLKLGKCQEVLKKIEKLIRNEIVDEKLGHTILLMIMDLEEKQLWSK